MKFVKAVSLAMTAVLVLGMSGCQKEDEKEKVPAKVSVDYLKDDEELKDCIEVTDKRFENASNIVTLKISTDQDILNVKITAVSEGTVTDELTKLFIEEEVYAGEKLTPDKPIVLKTVFPNFMPALALSYKDTTGEEKIWSITMSGNDNSLVMAPAAFEEGTAPIEEETAPDVENVSIRRVTDEEIQKLPSCHEFTDPYSYDPENYLNILIAAETTVKDFSIIKVMPGAYEGETSGLIKKEVLYHQDELIGGTPVVFSFTFPGDLPSRAISFTDSDGTKKLFAIGMSGYDGSITQIPAVITEEEAVLYIGYDAYQYNEYPAKTDGEKTPEKLIAAISELTGWKLPVHEMAYDETGITVDFAADHINEMLPEEQKEEFWVFDVCSFTDIVLDSIKETLQNNYALPETDPDSLNVYYSFNGHELVVEGITFPVEEPWYSGQFSVQ